MNVRVVDLGRMEYGAALELQRKTAHLREMGGAPDTLFIVEHDHVITLGRKTSQDNFRPQSVPVFQVERGGDATYHGPGQVVGYPIVLLEDHDVRRHVRGIEACIVETLREFGIEGGRVEGHPGVWVDGKKVCSIGVAVTNWVAYHGFALNVNTDLSMFELIRPCGMDPGTMTSMEKSLGEPVSMEDVKRAVAREYGAASPQAFSEFSIQNPGNIK
jgi:lipoate-protein ligase B